MQNVYTVGQVNSYIKNMFAQDFLLQELSVKGEVSNCKYHSSGHIYFTLKDPKGTISCIMFAGNRNKLSFRLQEGMAVVVRGTIDVYERDGRYQMYAKEISREGAGALYERYERLRQELLERGMFAPEYKKPIPAYVKTLGVVTAPTGAAVRDIINIASRRNPYVQIILYPALVQGENAAESIVKGIQMLERRRVDVIIVGRGGGSIEDLWAFNEEKVARAIFECNTPVISAVGHETDFTIADFVADMRAPTPSAAAELAVDDFRQIIRSCQDYQDRLQRSMQNKLDILRAYLKQYQMKMDYLSPATRLRDKRQRLVDLEEELRGAMKEKIKTDRHTLSLYLERYKGLSPLNKLNQGYSFVTDREGKAVTSTGQVQKGEFLEISVTDGVIEAEVVNSRKENWNI